MKDKIAKIAYSVFVPIMRASPERDHGVFKLMMTVDVDGQAKPLLLAGNAHANIEDGQCIAILNPDKGLENEVGGGVAYNEAILKDIVAGKCDAMFMFWFETYVAPENQIAVIGEYNSRTPKPAKFEVR